MENLKSGENLLNMYFRFLEKKNSLHLVIRKATLRCYVQCYKELLVSGQHFKKFSHLKARF